MTVRFYHRLVGPRLCEKIAECKPGNRTGSSAHPWTLTSLSGGLRLGAINQINPSLPKLLLVHGIWYSYRKQPGTATFIYCATRKLISSRSLEFDLIQFDIGRLGKNTAMKCLFES